MQVKKTYSVIYGCVSYEHIVINFEVYVLPWYSTVLYIFN